MKRILHLDETILLVNKLDCGFVFGITLVYTQKNIIKTTYQITC